MDKVSALTWLTVKDKHFKPFLVFWEWIVLYILDWVRTLSDHVESAFIELMIQVGTTTPKYRTRKFKEKMVTCFL